MPTFKAGPPARPKRYGERITRPKAGVVTYGATKEPLRKGTWTDMEVLERRGRVRKDLKGVLKEYFNWTDIQDFHIETLEAMFEGGYIVCNYPTDHAKSTMGCFLFPILSMMENPNETHIICGANVNDSRRRVQAIARELETNANLIYDYPWLAKPDDVQGRLWTQTAINIAGRTENKPNPSVLASAIGSGDIKGRRGKLIMDDIEGEDARWSPTKREQLYNWLKLEAWRCFEDRRETSRPLLALLGTPFDVDSIYFRMEAQGWRVIRYPVYRPNEDGSKVTFEQTQHGDFEPNYLWPAKKEKVRRARHSLTKIEFSVAYLMDPTGGDPNIMSSSELAERMTSMQELQNGFVTFVSLDPASGGQGRKVDYAGVAVVRINWPPGDTYPNVEIPDCYAFTQGLFEQVHLCAELAAQYDCPVIYEGNSQQGGTYEQTFGHLHPEVSLLRHYTSKVNKFDERMGLTVVKRLAIDRRLRVPPEKLEMEGTQHLISELRDLAPPFRLHNHICAAVWFAIRHVYDNVRHLKGPLIRTTYGRPSGWAQQLHAAEYRDDPGLSQYERAMRAMAYDAAARSPQPVIMGYRAIRQQQRESILERERRKEEERFLAALNRRRAI